MKKTLNFGKIDFNGIGRRINTVTIDIALCNGRFTVSGDIWNARKTDIICGGQCLDLISKFVNTPLFRQIYRLWKLYHLNDMKAGTPKQEQAVREWKNEGNKYDYTEVCKMLESKNLLFDESYLIGGKPYRYGTRWLKEEISSEDMKQITEILETH